jgi:hypothetical protein
MIDKKKLIEELLDCVADATDTETQITSLTMAGMLMNEVLDEVLTIPTVVRKSEQLVAFCRWYNQAIPSYETTEEEIVETYLRESN